MSILKYAQYLTGCNALRQIQKDVAEGTLSSFYLVLSEDNAVRHNLLRVMAMAIFCKHNLCLECRECRLIANNNFLDVYEMVDTLKVEAISKMMADLALSSAEGGYKVYLIPNFDQATQLVQNKLLKVLEEPPERVVFLLGAEREGMLLQTVLSRCVKLRLPPAPADTLYRALITEYGASPETELAAEAADGLFSRAEEMLDAGQSARILSEVLDVLERVTFSREVPTVLQYACFQRENFVTTLSFLSLVIRDIAVTHTGGGAISLRNMQDRITALSATYNLPSCILIQEIITEAREKIMYNCSATSVADSLLLKILEVKYKCRT